MYEDIIEIAENRAYLQAVNKENSGPNLSLLQNCKPYEELHDLEKRLRERNLINFDTIFHEPTGYYLIKCFMTADYSVDKAIFVSDIELYRKMRDSSARRKVARLIYERFVGEDDVQRFISGESVFERQKKRSKTVSRNSNAVNSLNHTKTKSSKGAATSSKNRRLFLTPTAPKKNFNVGLNNVKSSNRKVVSAENSLASNQVLTNTQRISNITNNSVNSSCTGRNSGVECENSFSQLSLNIGTTNCIGVYGKSVRNVKEILHTGKAPQNLFDEVVQDVLDDFRMDVFPRFYKSSFYKRYIQTKSLETSDISIKDFIPLRTLGRGAFGSVKACIKRDSGKIYAMKCLSKRHMMATDKGSDQLSAVMEERNHLSRIDSHFVVGLKYAVQDKESLYLILDLMQGGDLKFHLNKVDYFSEERSRFYAAEVLLGLEHIHSLGIIYRDIKLENILLDEEGHTKISDLGLSVHQKTVKGYAGTPGYTAPEVISGERYEKSADFFSFGVMVYRFLCGKKPFGRHPGDLDQNVLKIDPEYPEKYFSRDAVSLLKGLMTKDPKRRLGYGPNGIDKIKSHRWFRSIDFGLLEAGYISPPFVPNTEEVNADSLRHMQHPHTDKYKKIKLSEAFQRSIEGFNFVSKSAIQHEIVEVLEKADEGIDFRKFAPKPAQTTSDLEKGNPRGKKRFGRRSTENTCCTIV